MSKPDKPIFNQQGGRGKLYGPTHGATYMGTYQMPDGKMDRRMFNCATNVVEVKKWTEDEDKLVLIQRIPDRELSRIIKRSMKSISNRRWRLRKAASENKQTGLAGE